MSVIRSKVAYKLLQRIHEKRFDKYDYILLEELEEIIQQEEPQAFKLFKEDNYDGPPDGDAWSGGIADNH